MRSPGERDGSSGRRFQASGRVRGVRRRLWPWSPEGVSRSGLDRGQGGHAVWFVPTEELAHVRTIPPTPSVTIRAATAHRGWPLADLVLHVVAWLLREHELWRRELIEQRDKIEP